jgi:hypothetical protein
MECPVLSKIPQFLSAIHVCVVKNMSPLTDSTKGDKRNLIWTLEMEQAFNDLKNRFISVPVCSHYNPMKQGIVERDISDFAIGAVLSHQRNNKMPHPIAYHSRKLYPVEINYEIHDKELLAIVDSFKVWRR